MKVPIPNIKQKGISTAAPCSNCPFRKDVVPYLTKKRILGIYQAAVAGTTFVCHKTVDYGLFQNGPIEIDRGRRSCAGFLIVCQRDGIYEGLQIVQLAKRLLGMEFKFRGHEKVYKSFQEVIRAQR